MREVVLDTETTGLDPRSGHRIVEIGCVALLNHIPSGETFQRYINPERDMPEEAARIHGLSAEFLADKPKFVEIIDDFLTYIGTDKLIIHNAGFDLGFINAEFERLEQAPIPITRAVDTVSIARRKFPGAPANLDALCRRFGIDNSQRTKHGALLDAELLAEVYLELSGGRQADLGLSRAEAGRAKSGVGGRPGDVPRREPRFHAPSEEEAASHVAFVDQLDDPIWRK